MGTVKKLQLKLNLTNGKTATINLPQAKAGLSVSDLQDKFSPIATVFETDDGATVSSIEVSTVTTTTDIIADDWNADA